MQQHAVDMHPAAKGLTMPPVAPIEPICETTGGLALLVVGGRDRPEQHQECAHRNRRKHEKRCPDHRRQRDDADYPSDLHDADAAEQQRGDPHQQGTFGP